MTVIFFDDLQIFWTSVHQDILPIALHQECQVGGVHLDAVAKRECVHGFFVLGHLTQVQWLDGIGRFAHSRPSIHTLSKSTSSR